MALPDAFVAFSFCGGFSPVYVFKPKIDSFYALKRAFFTGGAADSSRRGQNVGGRSVLILLAHKRGESIGLEYTASCLKPPP
jgi:hypothetical protein